jgi:hypothetical protein
MEKSELGLQETLEEEMLRKSMVLNSLPKIDHSYVPQNSALMNMKRKASILEIMATVDSPSHWRFFENKRKLKSGEHSENFDIVPSKCKKYSPIRSLKVSKFIDQDYSDRIIKKQTEEEINRTKLLKGITLKKELMQE